MAIVAVMAGSVAVRFGYANPSGMPAGPNITVTYSPNFSTISVILKVYLTTFQDTNNCTREAWYSLDEQANVSIHLAFKGMINSGGYPFSEVTGQIAIPMWSQGPHSLKVSAKYTYAGYVLAESKILYIGQPEPVQLPPEFTVFSPQNQTNYNSSDVPVAYYVGSKIIWSYYALDTVGEPANVDWKFFDGNTTLTSMSEGSHKLVISLKTEGNPPGVPVLDETVFFTVGNHTGMPANQSLVNPDPTNQSSGNLNPQLSNLSFLIAVSISVVAVLAVVAVAVVVYLKKRRRENE